MAFDTGMRKSEVLNLRWPQVGLRAGAVRLEAEDTKTDEPRVVYLTERYNIIEEQDLKAAVQVLNRTRKAAQSGHESGTVDQK